MELNDGGSNVSTVLDGDVWTMLKNAGGKANKNGKHLEGEYGGKLPALIGKVVVLGMQSTRTTRDGSGHPNLVI